MRLGCVRGRGDGLRWDRSWRWVPAGDAGMTGARGRGTGVGRGFGCVQSVGRMCSVGWVNVFSFGRMCSVSGRMCSLLRAMCSVFGGARPPSRPPSAGSGQVLRGRRNDGEVSTLSGQCVQLLARCVNSSAECVQFLGGCVQFRGGCVHFGGRCVQLLAGRPGWRWGADGRRDSSAPLRCARNDRSGGVGVR